MNSTTDKSVLVVDDEQGMQLALKANFQREGWQVETASGAHEALRKFDNGRFPLIVTDVRMPDGDGLHLMRTVRNSNPSTAVILLTAFGNVPEAVEAMQGGACDYLMKPISFERLQSAVTKVMHQAASITSLGDQTGAIVGSAPALLRSLARARHAARTKADVLIEAESGTGKELLARFIHEMSDRHAKPFIAVNCAAVPEQLLESELFGHVRGAFTGATNSKSGKFELAAGGTLLLDEIGEMSLNLQPKLLRVLQEREFERLGDTRTTQVDVRIIATTNISLHKMVEEGAFRADLFYRLNVIPLTLPPLRERLEDIPALAEFFAREFAKQSDQAIPRLHPEFLQGLQEHSWPGNVRELANYMRRVITLSEGNEIGADSLRSELVKPAQTALPIPITKGPVRAGTSMRELERRLLETTLEVTGGNRTKAAEMLGVSLRTIRNKIREFGLPPRRYAWATSQHQ